MKRLKINLPLKPTMMLLLISLIEVFFISFHLSTCMFWLFLLVSFGKVLAWLSFLSDIKVKYEGE